MNTEPLALDSLSEMKSQPPKRAWGRIAVWSAVSILFFLFVVIRIQLAKTENREVDLVDDGVIPHAETAPSPMLTPRQVVWAQVESLRAAQDAPERLAVCFEFASPENRKLTGPIERFSAMVAAEPFNKLGNSEKFEIGRTNYIGENAAVSVTTFDGQGGEMDFQFVLRRQTEAPFQKCWMTEGVIPFLPQ